MMNNRGLAAMKRRLSALCLAAVQFWTVAAARGGDLAVQYRCTNTDPHQNQIGVHFQIVNRGRQDAPLRELTIRYWFVEAGDKPLKFWCDYAKLGGTNVAAAFHKLDKPVTGADSYLEISFSEAAGFVPAGGDSGEIQTRSAKDDWSNFDQSRDYSFDASKTAFTDAPHITLYRRGRLAWGVEPAGALKPMAAKPAETVVSHDPPAKPPAVLDAEKLLGTDPDNAQANLTVGRWLSFSGDDWPAGLPLLAKGSDAALAGLAKRDLAAPTAAAAQIELADGWWDLAQSKNGPDHVHLTGRAIYWYQQAKPNIHGGFTELKINRRLEAAGK
jgi:hypothetical protein